jgi:hypothetical protein
MNYQARHKSMMLIQKQPEIAATTFSGSRDAEFALS